MQPVLQLQHISKKYDDTVVLDNISLSLQSGQWLGILGESGSGKSTLLQIIGRFLDADNGTVTLNGKELPPVSSQLLKGYKGVKLVHQDYHLFPNQTVFENIYYEVRFGIKEESKQRTEELIALAGLQNEQHQKAKQLSGGQKQRTAIATALALVPDLLLLDEPFAHLDSRNRARLTALFQALKAEEALPAIFVTHEPAEALDWADQLIILHEGKILQIGTPQEIYEYPVNAYVAELTGVVNWLTDNQTTFIRPEKIRTYRKEPAKYDLKGKVHSVHYRGVHWEYRINTGSNYNFAIYRLKNDLLIGDTVFLRYSEKDIRTF